MKSIHINKMRLLLTVVSILVVTASFGSSDKFTRTIKKEYSISSNARVIIDNKYGKIHCSNWEKNAVSIEVTITVDALNEQKAARIFDMISVDMEGSNSEVSAQTEISDNFSGNKDNTSVKIDYMVYMPETVSVSLENKFGDIYLENVRGSVSIDLSYGSMEAKNLSNTDNDLEIKFSKASIESIAEFTAEIKYSEVIVYDCKKMTAETKFSTMRIEKITYADIDSQYDTYLIGDMQASNIEAEFSTLKITKLLKKIGIDSQYGSVQLKYVAPGFSEIKVYNKFGDLEIGIDEDASYSVDATIKMGSFTYPRENAALSKETEGYTTDLYRGIIGTNKSTSSSVYIESANAGVTIKAW